VGPPSVLPHLPFSSGTPPLLDFGKPDERSRNLYEKGGLLRAVEATLVAACEQERGFSFGPVGLEFGVQRHKVFQGANEAGLL